MKLAGWILLPSCLVGLIISVVLMIQAFNRISAAVASATPSGLSNDLRLAMLPTFLGIGLSICGLILLSLSRRRSRAQGFPVQSPPV